MALAASAGSSRAEVSEEDSIRAGAASALAAADYARKHCPRLRIDDAALDPILVRLGTSIDALRQEPDYADQERAMIWIDDYAQPGTACDGLTETFEYRADGLIRYR